MPLASWDFPSLNLVLFIGLGLKMRPQIPFIVSLPSLTPWKTFVIYTLNYAILVLHDSITSLEREISHSL